MLYEGIPTGKKKEKPVHPAPKHEAVFGRKDTIATLEDGVLSREETSIKKKTPKHDSLFGPQNKFEVAEKISANKRQEYQEGMGITSGEYQQALKEEVQREATSGAVDFSEERRRREPENFLSALLKRVRERNERIRQLRNQTRRGTQRQDNQSEAA